ncbi:MAG: hypothetical protein WDN49_20470 [Acetobacteraceae bacterium]
MRADTTLAAFKRAVPLGAVDRVVVVDDTGRYAGIVLTPEAHAAAEGGSIAVAELLHYTGSVLQPQMTIKQAVELFETSESDALGGGGRGRDDEGDRAADRAIRAAAVQRGTGPAKAGAVGGDLGVAPRV